MVKKTVPQLLTIVRWCYNGVQYGRHWSWAWSTHYPVYLTVSGSTTGGLLQSANLRGDVANVYLIDWHGEWTLHGESLEYSFASHLCKNFAGSAFKYDLPTYSTGEVNLYRPG